MNTIKNFSVTLVMVSVGYGMGYVQFKVDAPKNLNTKQPLAINSQLQKSNHQIEKVRLSNSLVSLKPKTKITRCQQIAQNPILDTSSIGSTIHNEETYPLYTTEEHQRAIEKSIVPQVTEVMLKIHDSEKKELLDIIESEEDDSEWGYQYEDQISSFIAGNTVNQAVNITQLVCKTNYCQLEVTFDDETSWMGLYKTMSKQPWWNSVAYQTPAAHSNTHSIILHRMDAEQLYDSEGEYTIAEAEDSL